MTARQRVAVMVVVVGFGIFGFIVAVQAQSTVEIPITTVLRGNPGDVFLIDTVQTPPGQTCDVDVESRNNESMRLGTDILVGPLVFADVESGVFQTATGSFTSTGSVAVSVRLTAATVFSGGLLVTLECGPDNQVSDWCETGVKFDNLTGPTFTVPTPPTDTVWTLLVLKSGLDHETFVDPVVGQTYAPSNGKDVSHAILCHDPVTDTTTTTIPETGTTIPDTTTTSIPTGVPSGLGPVGDEAGFSPLTTWTLLIGAFLIVALFAALLIHGGNRRQDDE